MNPEEAKALAQTLIAGIERESQTTRKVVAAIPENQLDFKLGEKGRTARELAWHLIASETWFADGIAKGDFSQPEAEAPPNASVKDMLAYYDQFPAKVEKLKSLSGDNLAKEISFFNVMHLPNVLYLGFLTNHSIHHRGQLSTYLRAMNAHVPSIYGGSADEPFEMPATA
jgi:uncharacterized damage-inducible protein DinB